LIDEFDISGRIAVITGAGGALAGAVSRGLAARGVKVAILDLDGKKAEACRDRIRETGGEVHSFACSVLSEEELKDCYRQILSLWGEPDFLLNGAGGNHPGGTTDREFLEKSDLAEDAGKTFFTIDMKGIEATFALNFYGTVLPSRIFSRGMVEKGSGGIVNISSMNAFTPLTKIPAYSAAKASVSNFTHWMAAHFAHTGVRVNAIAPGFFMTEQLRFLHIDQTTGEYTPRAQQVIAQTPMGRYGKPEELVGITVWLFSAASSFVTGTVIPVDGGFSSYVL
jgi:NAD(P)-dependent dehydrogenase (short-subunit alcohol dehydrogenase family)